MPYRMALVFALILALLPATDLQAQSQTSGAQPAPGTISKADRDTALGILDAISKGIQGLYYDPKMNGLDWNAVREGARAKIVESNTLNEALTQIAVAVSALNDSHTIFVPPARPYNLDFGFEYKLIWNRCFVMRVRPGSDAEAQGLKQGSEILRINGIAPNRQNFSSIQYLIHVLDPRPEMQLEVRYASKVLNAYVQGETQKLKVKAKLTMSPDLAYRPGAGVRYDIYRRSENASRRMRMRYRHFGDVGILKFPLFDFGSDDFDWLHGEIRGTKP